MAHQTQSDSNLEKFEKQKRAMEQHLNTFFKLTSEMIREEHETSLHEAKSKASLAEVVAEQQQELDDYKKRLADTEAKLELKKRECDQLETLVQEQEKMLFVNVENDLKPPAKRPRSQEEEEKKEEVDEDEDRRE